MHVQRAPAGAVKALKIADGLRHLQYAEREPLAWNGEVIGDLGGDDDEHAVVGAAFVELTGGVEIARTVAEHRRAARALGDSGAELVERLAEGWFVRWQVGHQAEV